MVWSKESRQARGYGSDWDRVRKQVVARDKGLCQNCDRAGRVAIGREVDHIVPKAVCAARGWTKAQTDALDNLELTCHSCHERKTAKENGRKYHPKIRYGVDGWPIEE